MTKFIRIIFPVLLVSLMFFIFLLSHQPASESSQTSSSVIRFLANILILDFKYLSTDEQLEIISSLQFIVRKGAHFSAYFMLGVFSFCSFITYPAISLRLRSLISFGICFCYSVSDEIHQLFIPGRSGEVRDVMIDTSGSILAILILLFIFSAVNRKKNFKGDTL